jgi:hypothetical protein
MTSSAIFFDEVAIVRSFRPVPEVEDDNTGPCRSFRAFLAGGNNSRADWNSSEEIGGLS